MELLSEQPILHSISVRRMHSAEKGVAMASLLLGIHWRYVVIESMEASIRTLIDHLESLSERDIKPFPYRGLSTIRRITQRKWQDLNPDLDQYQSLIAGCCSSGRAISCWPLDKIEKVKASLGHSFFELYPRYLPMRRLITPRLTPDLYADFVLYEEMRKTMLHLLDILEDERESTVLVRAA